MPNTEPNLLLQVWENYWNCTPCEQAVALVTKCFPELQDREVLMLPIGRRDLLLMSLRTSLFGSAVELVCECPQCKEQCELSFDLSDMQQTESRLSDISIERDGVDFRFRLPNSFDLLEMQNCRPVDPRHFLAQKCLLIPQTVPALPQDLVDHVSDLMGEQDSHANIHLDTNCASCHHEWEVPFDIVSVVWTELSAWAQRLIGEIHVLASSYGWNESEILALTPVRRQIYLSILSK
jgi:hypothetical protein